MIDVKYKKPAKEQGNKYKIEIPLLTLLANESTDGSRKILKKHGKEDAVNHIDLENKLADYYSSADDKQKLEIEKELAEIHPHKDFIINALDLVPKKDIQVVETITKEVVVEPAPAKVVEEDLTVKQVGKFSNATGDQPQSQQQIPQFQPYPQKDNTAIVLGVVAIIALIALSNISVAHIINKR
jgi:hypothetical protein